MRQPLPTRKLRPHPDLRDELVRLFLDRGADPVERDAEPWATPLAWAEKKGHSRIVSLLRDAATSNR